MPHDTPLIAAISIAFVLALLFGALADKYAADMLPRLLPHVGDVTLTTPASSRALVPRDLALLAPQRETRIVADAAAALSAALAGGSASRPLLVCGSLYLVGDLRKELRRRFGAPEPLTSI